MVVNDELNHFVTIASRALQAEPLLEWETGEQLCLVQKHRGHIQLITVCCLLLLHTVPREQRRYDRDRSQIVNGWIRTGHSNTRNVCLLRFDTLSTSWLSVTYAFLSI